MAKGNQPGLFIGRVVRCGFPCHAHFRLSLAAAGFPSAEPGQFVHLRCPDALVREPTVVSRDACGADQSFWSAANPTAPLLRRPFSIAGLRLDGRTCEIDLLGRVVGPGTSWLASLAPGDAIDVLGPLGNAFSMPGSNRRALLVAGGVGLPPIRWLGERLRTSDVPCDAIYGAQTRTLLPVTLLQEPSPAGDPTFCVAEFARDGIPVAITTDDGSCGLRGRVTDRLSRYLDECRDASLLVVYACGPHAMLREVASICLRRRIECELAMERTMGCGLGTCQSCVVKVVDEAGAIGWRYALCCTEGPVFKASQLIWE